MTDDTAPHPNDELHELVALLVQANQTMLDRERCVGLAILELQRLTTRKLRILEELTTTLTGIRSDGREA
jgi:hypothetical protein